MSAHTSAVARTNSPQRLNGARKLSAPSSGLVLIILTYVVGIGRFAHIIAGSVEALYVASISQAPLSANFSRFFVPALAGEIVGGVSLVVALAHAPHVAHAK